MTQPFLKRALHSRGIKLAAVARALAVDKGTLTKWNRGRIPAERVLDVEHATGISREELRPDLYPPADLAPSSPASPPETTGK